MLTRGQESEECYSIHVCTRCYDNRGRISHLDLEVWLEGMPVLSLEVYEGRSLEETFLV